jgi:hypothetical protein
MPWAATADSAGGKPAAAPQAVPLKGFFGVMRAARIEAASGRQERAHAPAVGLQQEAQSPRDHAFSLANTSRSRRIISAEGRAP